MTEITALFGQTPRVFLAMLPSIAIVFPLAILTRSIAATNTITLLYIFIVEPILTTAGRFSGALLSHLTLYLPFQLTQSLVRQSPNNIPEENLEEFMSFFIDPNLAALGILLWVLVLGIVSWLLFRQQDLTS